jgi:ABC-type multidrug transport system ATPase subunit
LAPKPINTPTIFAAIVLQAVNLSKRFGETVAVRDVSFTVERGEVLGLLGSNGAGKSTTVRMLAGLVRPDQGNAFVGGHDMAAEPLEAKAVLGYLPETVTLYDRLTFREYLEFVGPMYDLVGPELGGRIDEIAAKVELARNLDAEMGTFSKGMLQRAALAGATLHRPAALILDEPGSGLDPRFIRTLKNWVRELAKDTAVLVCTHVTSFAEDISDRLAIMHDGSILATGTLKDLRIEYGAEDLEETFVRVVERW